jgi:hypothetical protein
MKNNTHMGDLDAKNGKTNTLSWIFRVLVHWNNSLWVRGMCFITHSSIFQFIALLFYNIVIHVAELLIMCCFCNKYFLLMNICLSFVLFYFQKLSSWIIYKVHVHVHILPNQDWLVPEFSTFSILILICYYWSPDIGINTKGWSASWTETTR